MAERTAPVLNIFGPQTGPPDAAARSGIMRSRLERYFELSVFLLLTSAFVTIAGTGALGFPSVAFVSLALFVRGWLLIAGRDLSLPQKWDSYFSYGYLAFYAADYFFLTRSFVSATVHLVLFSMVVKFFSVRRDRDYVYLAVLAFLEVLAASILTIDSIFLAAFSLFALLAVNTFITLEIRRSWTSSSSTLTIDSPRNNAYAPPRFAHSLSLTAFVLVIGIVLIGTAVFFVLPRVTGGYFSHLISRNGVESGFSEEVRLGQIGEIQQSSSVTMHIEISGDRTGSHNLKWRGVALSLFDGRRWFNPLSRNLATSEIPDCYNVSQNNDDHATSNACGAVSPPGSNLIAYRVLMEPLGTSVFFLTPHAQSLTGHYRQVTVDGAGAVYSADPSHAIGMYQATSDLSSPPPEKLREAANFYPAAIALRYLQLPPRLDPSVRQLAEQITVGSHNSYDKASAIEHYLHANFGYTLRLPQPAPADPVANFLFQRKEGHCEYFATSMAIMLRTIGIPSRLVNGFSGGEFNDISGSYIIRARDAHSWVEVYFPGSGWISFDPTPAGPSLNAGIGSRFSLYLDAMREFWREWIINYDFSHQLTLSEAGSLSAVTTMDRFRRWAHNYYVKLILHGYNFHKQLVRRPRSWLYVVLSGMVLIALLFNLGRIIRAVRDLRISRSPERAPEAAASLWYRRMTRALARRGWRKLPSQTPQEFAAVISDPILRQRVLLFTTHYERARFADSAADAQRLSSLYEAVLNVPRQP